MSSNSAFVFEYNGTGQGSNCRSGRNRTHTHIYIYISLSVCACTETTAHSPACPNECYESQGNGVCSFTAAGNFQCSCAAGMGAVDCSAVIGTSLAGVSFSCWSLMRWRLDVYVSLSLSLSLSALIVVELYRCGSGLPAGLLRRNMRRAQHLPMPIRNFRPSMWKQCVRLLARLSMKRCQSGTHALHHRSFS